MAGLLCRYHFYRAMHVVLAQYCYHTSSICPSVHPSATLMYRGHMCWVSSKLITRILSLGLRSSKPQHRQSSPRRTPQNSGAVCGYSRRFVGDEASNDSGVIENIDFQGFGCYVFDILGNEANIIIYRIYSRISRKIYHKILTEKLGGDLSAGHKL